MASEGSQRLEEALSKEAIKLKSAEMEPSSGVASASASSEETKTPGGIDSVHEVETASVAALAVEQRVESFMKNLYPRWGIDMGYDETNSIYIIAGWFAEWLADSKVPLRRELCCDDVSVTGALALGGGTVLHWAVRMEDFESVTRILEEGQVKDVNARDEVWKATALHWAVRTGNMGIVEAMCNHFASGKFDFEVVDKWGFTVLEYAVMKRNVPMVKALLQFRDVHLDPADVIKVVTDVVRKGASMEVLQHSFDSHWETWFTHIQKMKVASTTGTSFHWGVRMEDTTVAYTGTSLHWAVRMEDTTLASHILTENKVDVNAIDSHRYTPLHFAISSRNLDMVKIMVAESKVDVNVKDRHDDTPLHLAVRSGNLDMVKIMVAEGKVDMNVKSRSGQTPFQLAVLSRNVEIVKIMVAESKVDVNVTDRHNDTPLHLAVRSGNLDMVKIMVVEGKVDVNVKSRFGHTPFQLAVLSRNVDMVMIMVAESKVDVNIRDRHNDTPLHLAVSSGNVDMVKIMVAESKVDVNVRDRHSDTPLHLAVSLGNVDMVKIMVAESKVDANVRDRHSDTPLHLAVSSGNVDMVKIMVAESKVDVNVRDRHNDTPLHLAVSSRNVDMVKIMVADGKADVNVRNTNGITPFQLAVLSKNVDMVKIMVAKDLELGNFNVNFVEAERGYTTLHLAIPNGEEENIDLVRELLKCKETMRLIKECHTGETPLQIAHERGFKDIQKSLMECAGVQRFEDNLYRDRQVYVHAANAILVGATLIASVTFASWLQLPLGDGTLGWVGVQHNQGLRAFRVYSYLSFYSAIATVVSGARSVLPRSPYSIKVTVEKSRKNLLVTTFLLACSVFFVIMSFGIAGYLLQSPTIMFRLHMIIPTIMGGLVCVVSLVSLSKSVWQDSSFGKNTTLMKEEEWNKASLEKAKEWKLKASGRREVGMQE